MALTALEIYKYLPKTNCTECGSPTCLAFAMQIAAKKVELAKCPHISQEAKQALEQSSAPPIRLVTLGGQDNKVELGNESVMFRHEKTFYHQSALAVYIDDNLPEEEFEQNLNKIKRFSFERVGQNLKVELVFLNCRSQDKVKYCKRVEQVLKEGLLLILGCEKPDILDAALQISKANRPLIYKADKNNLDAFCEVAKKNNVPLAVEAENLEELSGLTKKANQNGVMDLVVQIKAKDLVSNLCNLTQIRRLALKRNDRSFGYPSIVFAEGEDLIATAMPAAAYICKYGSIVVLKNAEDWQILPLLTLRQNIYTDPQKPIQVESKIYEVGAVDENSPLLITTNFSLTYFTVEADVEASRVPSRILVVDTEGTSVLTAWAAEKLTVEKIVEALKKNEIENKLKHKTLIIPGYVSVMSGKLEDESGWKVVVGPRESSGIPAFLKGLGKAQDASCENNSLSR
ncbi:MAG: acetyl-CoA decarbonylase/synthase complex subunit gamma [Candidatus Omnitrophica bacterium]|nr:acetyl-CoA decarbonylase/synthase complex subunit gamma [Candidatus Omnitrophota bacterium]MBU1925239.1 acetyl-CoA decarbonylase/synthase complex subunit gamma [Candidatus Omnitrophota bacterium]